MGSARRAGTERQNIIPACPCWQRLLPPQFPRPALLCLVLENLPALLGFSLPLQPSPRSSLKALFMSPFSNGGDTRGCRERSRDRAGDSLLARVRWSLLCRARNHFPAGAHPQCAPGRHAGKPRACRRKGAVEQSGDAQRSLQGQHGTEPMPCPRDESRFIVCPRHVIES